MNLFVISLLGLCLGIELLFVSILISLFFPQHLDPIIAQLFDVYRQNVIPERDVFFYRLFIFMVIFIFTLLMVFRKHYSSSQGLRGLKQFTFLEVLVVSAQVFCAFKLLLFRQIVFLHIYYFFLGFSVLSKIFWPEIRQWMDRMNQHLKDDSRCSRIAPRIRWLFIPVIIAIVWVPDYGGAVARMFIGEQFHHMDYLLMPPGWAHISGNIIGVDNLSRYGIGAPVFVSEIAQRLLGGFTYENALLVMMAIAVVYYLIWYWTFRRFLGGTMLAMIGILIGIRLQLFHEETFPFAFTYPQLTPLRFFFDAILFALLVRHILRPKFFNLALAALASGIAIYNATGEGLYLLSAFYIFLMAREIYARRAKDNGFSVLNIRQHLMLIILPWLTMFLCVWATVGKNIFGKQFWDNQFEFIRFYAAGHQSQPLVNNLVPGFVLEASMAFVLPAIYALVLVWIIGLMIEKKVGRQGLVVLAAIAYALADYHYHAQLSNNTTAYLRIGLVLAFLACFWLSLALKRWDTYRQRLILLATLAVVIVSIVTNHIFLLYPNIFNLSRNPMTHPVVSQNPPGRFSYFNHLFVSYPDAFKLPVNSLGEKDEELFIEKDFKDDQQLKDFYRQEIDYSRDAALINQLVPAGEQVPLISSFEIPILMQAKRRPFFYTLDLVNSRPRRMRNFVVTLIYTADNFNREIQRMESRKPEYVFMEKIFLTHEVPQAYLHDSQDLISLLNYILTHYEPAKYGEYLVAMKRKS